MHELFIKAKLENLDTVLDFVSTHIGDCPQKIQNQINLVVDEIFSNIAKYCYNDIPTCSARACLCAEMQIENPLFESTEASYGTTDCDVTVRIVIDEDIVIEFEDKGVPYNPLKSGDPDITSSTEEREIGGLGIFLVKKLMDTVEYTRINDKNVLVIKKKIL